MLEKHQSLFVFFVNLERRPPQRRMKLRKQVTVCGGAIFCVAVFSLYLMLDRVQHDPARRQNGGNFPRVRVVAVMVIHTVDMMDETPLMQFFFVSLHFADYVCL